MWRVKSRATSPRDALPKLFDISHGHVPWRESGDFDSLQTNVRITTIDSRLNNLWKGVVDMNTDYLDGIREETVDIQKLQKAPRGIYNQIYWKQTN